MTRYIATLLTPLAALLLALQPAFGQFTPSVTSGLAVHLDPSDVSTVTLDTGVSMIADKATDDGSNDDFSQSDGGNQPAYITSGGPGLNNYLEFTGHHMVNTTYLPAGEKTVFAVVRVPEATLGNGNKFFYTLHLTGGLSGLAVRYDSSPGQPLEFRRAGDENLADDGRGPLDDWYIQTVIDSPPAGPDSGLHYIQNGLEQPLTGGSSQAVGTSDQNTLAVRGDLWAGGELPYDFAQFLVYDRVLSAAEINQVGAALGSEFEVPWIPEPSAVVLLTSGLAGLAGLVRRRRR